MDYEQINELLSFINETFPENSVTITINEDSREYYTSVMDKLDDCTFVEVIDRIKHFIDLKEFDELINKDELTMEEYEQVESWIDITLSIVSEIVKDKIKNLQEVLNMIVE